MKSRLQKHLNEIKTTRILVQNASNLSIHKESLIIFERVQKTGVH